MCEMWGVVHVVLWELWDKAGQEVRKSMEDADNTFPKSLFLCLGRLPQSGEGHTGKFGKDNGYGFPV